MTGREMTYPETGRRTGTRKIGGRNTGRQVAGSQATGGQIDRRKIDRRQVYILKFCEGKRGGGIRPRVHCFDNIGLQEG